MNARLAPLSLALATLLAGPAPAAAPEVWTADPGTTVVLVRDDRAPLVEVRVEFPAGSWSPWFRDAPAGEAFEIQLHVEDDSLRARADGIPVAADLRVLGRYCRLWLRFDRADIEVVSDWVRDLLSSSAFDRAVLSRRKRERSIQWRADEKLPFFRLWQGAHRALYAEDDPRRLAWEAPPRMETRRDRLAAARDLLVRVPGRRVGFAGHVTRDEADAVVRRMLPESVPEVPPGIEPELGPAIPVAARADEIRVGLRGLTQVYFAIVAESTTSGAPDYAAFRVADHVLGGHFYSRMSVALRHATGDSYGAWSRSRGDAAPGVYMIGSFTRTDNIEPTLVRLWEALRAFHAEGITEDERHAALGFLSGARARVAQSPGQRLARAMGELRQGFEVGHHDRVVERAAALSLAEINAFIDAFYDPGRFTLVRVGPRGKQRGQKQGGGSRGAPAPSGASRSPQTLRERTR
ncbi:MAG: insulinase family protein [bacterium]|nr:insulinase family protein [bacterium]